MELLSQLGINGKLLLAQIINFLILLFILYKFAYGPILKMLDERTKTIEKGIKDADEAKKKLIEITEKEKKIMHDAKKNAQEIIAKAQKAAISDAQRIAEESELTSKKIMEDARQEIRREKEQIILEAKKEVGELVILTADKVIGEKLDSEKDKKIIGKIIK